MKAKKVDYDLMLATLKLWQAECVKKGENTPCSCGSSSPGKRDGKTVYDIIEGALGTPAAQLIVGITELLDEAAEGHKCDRFIGDSSTCVRLHKILPVMEKLVRVGVIELEESAPTVKS